MNPASEGENLIFLISQPRAGSTLLQQLLGNHPDIYTVPEPWLMLHPLYALKTTGYEAEYNAGYSQAALNEFLTTLPGGEQTYIEGIRKMYSHLYGTALSAAGKRYFLDKTPRYYFTILELHRTFPKAQFIILLRNPLAVLCSILSTWTKGNWSSLQTHEPDLIQAPQLLIEGMRSLGQQAIVMHYETLLSDPAKAVSEICDRLNIEFSLERINYDASHSARSSFGDKKSVSQYTQPNCKNLGKWVQELQDPQVWRLANDYLEFLGSETLGAMGYSYDDLKQLLSENRPSALHAWLTFSLFDFLNLSKNSLLWKQALVNFNRLLKKQGSSAALARIVQKMRQISISG